MFLKGLLLLIGHLKVVVYDTLSIHPGIMYMYCWM